MAVGMPAAVLAAVVPAPPWCTAAAHRGNSHPCGTWSTTCTSGDRAAPPLITPRPPQPAEDSGLSCRVSNTREPCHQAQHHARILSVQVTSRGSDISIDFDPGCLMHTSQYSALNEFS